MAIEKEAGANCRLFAATMEESGLPAGLRTQTQKEDPQPHQNEPVPGKTFVQVVEQVEGS